MAKKQLVPYTRPAKRGNRGKDVLAIKRALVHQGALDSKLKNLSNRWGPKTQAAVKKYQSKHGLRRTGTYTRSTHSQLRKGKHFDRYGARLMRDYRASTRARKRQGAGEAVASAALYAAGHRPRHYTQSGARWQPVDRVPWRKHMWDYGDCSSFATGCYREARQKDPNGSGGGNYRWGYTGTLCQNGRAVSSPAPGDLVFYGSGAPWGHVAVYVGGGRVVSHGHEGGPFLVPMNYRSDRGQIRRYV